MTETPDLQPSIEQLIRDADACIHSAPSEALALADRALASLEGRDDAQAARLRVDALRARGLAHHYTGRHARGLDDLNLALEGVPADNPALRSATLRDLSTGCELLGALDDALHWAKLALDEARRLGNDLLESGAQVAVGVAFSRVGDPEAGLAHFRQALALQQGRDPTESIAVLNNMGINLKNLERYEESAAHFERALAIVDTTGDAMTRAVLRSNLAETLARMGRHEDARAALLDAIETLQQGARLDALADARIKLGRVLLALGERDAAQVQLDQGLELADTAHSRDHASRAHQALASLHKSAGRFELSLRHHEAFHAAERAQFNADSDRKLASLRVQLEVADARHEAELHQLKHVQIAAAHAELQALHAALLAADAEKNMLLTRLAEQSRTDPLTGLANRRHLDEWLAAELALARRHGQPLTVAMCDLDFFKRINDRLGHGIGDTVLRQVATLLRERCRATDLVARYGGEEFCIAFPQTDGAAAAHTCEELREAVARHDWAAVHPELVVTVSIGLSDDLGATSHERLLADADMHLYRAKRDGKNRVRWRGDGPE